MKILAWNLLNIGRTKLTNALSPTVRAASMGNTVLDYIVKVAMANSVWSGIDGFLNTSPVDIFMIIELKSGGETKGAAVSGAAIPVLTSITNAMNTVAGAFPVSSPFRGKYNYDYVTPQVTGYHECVGLIYNTVSLSFTSDGAHAGVLKDNVSNRYLLPRTPWWAQLKEKSSNKLVNMVGIHAPPTCSGQSPFMPPVQFSNLLQNIKTINQTGIDPKQAVCIMGDFNCDSSDTYAGVSGTVKSFVGMSGYGYSVKLAAATLTSVRSTIDNENMKPENYLSGAYDNILINFSTSMAASELDLIGNAPIYDKSQVAVFNGYRTVSDHLPVILQ